MDSLLHSLSSCFGSAEGTKRGTDKVPPSSVAYCTEKAPLCESHETDDDDNDLAAEFTRIMRTAEKNDTELKRRLNSIVTAESLKQKLAERIIDTINKAIQEGWEMGAAMKEAVEESTKTASEFANEHPYYTVMIAAGTVVAIGVLVLLAPWVLEVVGFASRGPRLGSFAARWMSRIARSSNGEVSKGSVYAFLQRLGMTWK